VVELAKEMGTLPETEDVSYPKLDEAQRYVFAVGRSLLLIIVWIPLLLLDYIAILLWVSSCEAIRLLRRRMAEGKETEDKGAENKRTERKRTERKNTEREEVETIPVTPKSLLTLPLEKMGLKEEPKPHDEESLGDIVAAGQQYFSANATTRNPRWGMALTVAAARTSGAAGVGPGLLPESSPDLSMPDIEPTVPPSVMLVSGRGGVRPRRGYSDADQGYPGMF
jgi:hypothetical protein